MSPTRLFAGAALLMLTTGPLYAYDPFYLPSKEFASRSETMSSNLSLPSAAWQGQDKKECVGADTLNRSTYTPSRLFKSC